MALITCEVEGAIDPESLDGPLQTRVYNLKSTKVIRDLDPSDIGTLVYVMSSSSFCSCRFVPVVFSLMSLPSSLLLGR